MPTNDGTSAVSNCYVFKSQLQEYAQKVGFATPVYETTKEGPSHEPFFKSTVIVNDVRYDSLPGFSNRKTAEQSAAEVALLELSKTDDVKECISPPVHETGLCKNLLQEYAQKMNYAIPLYKCQRSETPSRETFFTCTVDIGGIQYIGAAAKTKKEAEIKAARTALLAIRTSPSELANKQVQNSSLTVLPCKKRGPESGNSSGEATGVPKPKKRKKSVRKRFSEKNLDCTEVINNGNSNTKSAPTQTDASGPLVTESTSVESEAAIIPLGNRFESSPSKKGLATIEDAQAKTADDSHLTAHTLVSDSNNCQPNANVEAKFGLITSMGEEVSITDSCQISSAINDSAMVQTNAASIRAPVSTNAKCGQITSEVEVMAPCYKTPSMVNDLSVAQMDDASVMPQSSADVEGCGQITSMEKETNVSGVGEIQSAVNNQVTSKEDINLRSHVGNVPSAAVNDSPVV